MPRITSAPAGITPGISPSIPSLPQTHPFLKVEFHLLCEPFPVITWLMQKDVHENVMSKTWRSPSRFSPHDGPAVPRRVGGALWTLHSCWLNIKEPGQPGQSSVWRAVVLRHQVNLTSCKHLYLKLQTLVQQVSKLSWLTKQINWLPRLSQPQNLDKQQNWSGESILSGERHATSLILLLKLPTRRVVGVTDEKPVTFFWRLSIQEPSPMYSPPAWTWKRPRPSHAPSH